MTKNPASNPQTDRRGADRIPEKKIGKSWNFQLGLARPIGKVCFAQFRMFQFIELEL